MSVHFKFKNTITHFETITFREDAIPVNEFKRKVVQLKHLSKSDDDLKVVNAETKREYKNDDNIPKNTSVILSRVPRTPQSKTTRRVLATKQDAITKQTTNVKPKLSGDDLVLDLSKLNISEEKKIEVMMQQSTAVYNPKTYQKLPPTTNAPSVPPPKSYQCKRCHLPGHWIQNCPILVLSKLKFSENRGKAGIPRSFLLDKQDKENVDNSKSTTTVKTKEEKPTEIPDDLLCPICKEIFVDAVMIPCCGNSFCDDCVRISILESENNKCPSCKEPDTSPDDLIPNRYLRKMVVSFKSRGNAASKPAATFNKAFI